MSKQSNGFASLKEEIESQKQNIIGVENKNIEKDVCMNKLNESLNMVKEMMKKENQQQEECQKGISYLFWKKKTILWCVQKKYWYILIFFLYYFCRFCMQLVFEFTLIVFTLINYLHGAHWSYIYVDILCQCILCYCLRSGYFFHFVFSIATLENIAQLFSIGQCDWLMALSSIFIYIKNVYCSHCFTLLNWSLQKYVTNSKPYLDY